MSDRDAELDRVAADLADALDSLREELEAERRGPPGTVELLRFTERYTIPAIVAVLEANIRVLELFAGSIRVAIDDERADDGRPVIGDAATATLDALDAALQDASRALSGGEPSNPEAHELLQEARELRTELDERLTESAADDRGEVEGEDNPVSIDVDSELDSIREKVQAEQRAGERLDDRLDDE